MQIQEKRLYEYYRRKFDHWRKIAGLEDPNKKAEIHSCDMTARKLLRKLEGTEYFPGLLPLYGDVYMSLLIITLADRAGFNYKHLLECARRQGLRVISLTRIDAALTLLEKNNERYLCR